MHLDLGMQPILSHLLTGANITTCNSCFEDEFLGDDVAKCNKNQRIVACSDGAFPNLGTTHCFTAAGRYGNNTFVSTGILRGCINCTGKINSSIPHFLFYHHLMKIIVSSYSDRKGFGRRSHGQQTLLPWNVLTNIYSMNQCAPYVSR